MSDVIDPISETTTARLLAEPLLTSDPESEVVPMVAYAESEVILSEVPPVCHPLERFPATLRAVKRLVMFLYCRGLLPAGAVAAVFRWLPLADK